MTMVILGKIYGSAVPLHTFQQFYIIAMDKNMKWYDSLREDGGDINDCAEQMNSLPVEYLSE